MPLTRLPSGCSQIHSIKKCVCLPLAESLLDRLVMLGRQIQAITAQLVGSIFECIVFGGLDFGK